MTAALLDRATIRPPATRQTRRPAGPKLRVLDQAASRRRARRRSALLILFVAVLAGFFAVAFVHAELVAGQHDLDAARADISEAEARHAELARAVEEASAPGVIVTRATELGMVRSRQPIYLTAAAPVRSIEVGQSLATPVDAETGDDGAGMAQVAAPAGTAPTTTPSANRIQGSLGTAGGISAAVHVPAPSSVALGPMPSLVGATTATGQPADASAQSTPADAAPTVTTVATGNIDAIDEPIQSGPVSSVAGTRAVSTPVDDTVMAPSDGETNSAAGASAGTNSAGGLASAAATTSG